ncbi:MAG: NAD(P)-dependent alcohol dehydrogenase [Melioribacteraceae bacterium]|nr:NAD(P)-dependent alcohol dehydrogenase [Melioribacteraceae bacterium]
MKAVVYTDYGPPDVLHVEERDKPATGRNEILIRNYAASVNYGDLTARNFKSITASEFNMPGLLWYPAKLSFGLSKPRNPILGSEFAGIVEEVGADVKLFKPGDKVFGYRGQKMGTYAEYICVSENSSIALMPSKISFEVACAIPYGALMAMNHLKKVNIEHGSKVLVNGASGAIGSAAVQLAKSYGAEITGVCGSVRMEFVKALGADLVIDYTKEDFTKRGETYDVIYDILGRSSFSKCKNSLNPGGRYLLASFKMKQLYEMLRTLNANKKVICALAVDKSEDLGIIKNLVEEGKLKTIIDKIFPMEQAAEAHRYAEEGNNKSNVVIEFNRT